MRDAEILQAAIKKAEQQGYNFKDAKIGIFYIFTHEFAKAFFGMDMIKPYYKCKGTDQEIIYECCNWKFHLQQMVLEENPIRYIEKFL